MAYFTEEGLEQMKNELRLLITEKRSKVAQDLAEAKQKGDLSENAEYDAAREAQALLEAKIASLEKLIREAKVLHNKDIDLSRVSIFCKATVKNIKTNFVSTFTLVSQEEADLKKNKISIDSPIGQGLLGKKIGDIAQITTPSGTIELEVVAIELGI